MPRNDLAELSREIEAAADVVLEKGVDAEQRRALAGLKRLDGRQVLVTSGDEDPVSCRLDCESITRRMRNVDAGRTRPFIVAKNNGYPSFRRR